MAVDINALLGDLAAETAPLVGLLGGIPAPAWDEPTPAPGWSVRDQVTHLAYFDQVASSSATNPAAFEVERAESKAGVAAYTESVAERYRSLGGEEVLAWFTSARARMAQVFATVDPSAKVPWFGPAMSAASSLTARIMETWAHGQDVYDALGAAHAPTAALRHVAHIGARALPNSFLARGLDVPDSPVRVELVPPPDLAAGGTWTWGPDDAADRVSGPAVDFCLVTTQRRHVADTALDATGPVATRWLEIAQAFAGPPGAGRQPGQFG